jgi:CDGSH-type Zn-finger protein
MTGSSETGDAPAGGAGRLAQVIATRGGLAPPEAPFVIEHREALIYMLCEAAELEHGIMCQYLFAAFSLKQDPAEGLTEAELAAVRSWRKVISHVATQEMLHLALVQNLLSAIGAAPHMSRPNFPHPASHYPAGVHLALLPFGEQALRHFMFLERPEGMALHDAEGLAAIGRAAPAMQAGDIVPRGQDFKTVGHLYRSIEAGFAHLASKYGERWLFVGPPRAQARQEHFGWPELIAVTDLASAQRAIEEILEQGEGPRGAWQDAHFGRFVEILDEFERAREADRAFVPVRPVIPVNVRPSERDAQVPLVTDPGTAGVMDLFNVAYEILLQIFERFFAHTEETDAQLKALADATIGLMFRVIKPLGDLITTLPAGPDYPDATVGPSFELFYESDYLLPHRDAAWALLTERLDTAAAFCQSVRSQAGPERAEIDAALDPVRAALTEIARALAAHLPASDPHSRPPSASATPAGPGPAGPGLGEPDKLAERVREFSRTRAGARPDDTTGTDLARVFDAAYVVVSRLLRSAPEDKAVSWAVPRLADSVLRPLADLLKGSGPAADQPVPDVGAAAPADPDGDGGEVAEMVWQAALAATRLRVRLHEAGGAPPELAEATAALQDLAVRLAPGEDRAAELRKLQGSLPAGIEAARNGPYLVTNVRCVYTHLGERRDGPPQLALCRCGGSSMKPLCDGAHARNGFSDAKDPKRVPDRRDTYPGQEVTIFDNRGICQHSGFCTDRLASVFRTGTEPFVAPSGGRMDEVIRAVRDCPSGALGLAIDGREERALADWHDGREPAIEITRDGPYRVTGGIALADAGGGDVVRAEGASREHYTLCRCGHSQNKPFCSGMHFYIGFSDPAADRQPSLFDWAGGLPALTRMTRLLYEKHVPADPLLAPLFAGMPPGHARREAIRIAEAFGGPADDGQDGSSQHGGSQDGRAGPFGRAPFSEEQRARWTALAGRAADEAGLPADAGFRAALAAYVEWDSRAAAGAAAPHWDWTAAGPPDTPAGAAGETGAAADGAGDAAGEAGGAGEEQPATLPGPGEPVSYAAHIRALFRQRDRQSMLFAFDLWSYDEVQAHAVGILERLGNGSMPCDGAWPAAQVEVFRRWTESGCPP